MCSQRSVVTIPACLVGSLVPTAPWQGTVLAVFPQAVNIEVDTLCLSLVADQRAMSSLSLTVPGLFQDAMQPLREALRLATGVRMVTGSIRLRVDASTTLAITLSEATMWHGALHASDVVGLQLHCTDALAQGLRRYGRAGGMLGLLAGETATSPLLRSTIASLQPPDAYKLPGGPCRKSYTSQKPLHRAWRPEKARGQTGGVIAVRSTRLSRFVGLGIGLTPSGDDFLTGVLLADSMSALAGIEPRLHVDRQDIATALERTNAPGRTLLWQALQGMFPAYLLAFARAFCAPNVRRTRLESADDTFEKCLIQVLEHGHTSGTDAVVGFWWYLEQVKGA